MSLFDKLETAANDIILANDFMNAGQYRLAPSEEGSANDGFHSELKRQPTFMRACRIAIAKGSPESTANTTTYMGTVNQTDVRIGDTFEVVTPRNQIRHFVVTAFRPTEEHTLVDLNEVRDVT